MTPTTVHLNCLPQVQLDVLSLLGGIADGFGFYLAGGTAVALHLGHRQSVDLDWFTTEAFDDPHRFAADLDAEGVAWEIVDQLVVDPDTPPATTTRSG